MKVSELSRRTGVQVPLIKYYLREGMLPPGRATAANQADYGEDHVRRLRLIRTLIGTRGLSAGATKEILDAITAGQEDLHQVLGIVLGVRPAKGAEPEPAPDPHPHPHPHPDPDSDPAAADSAPEGLAEARDLIDAMGWDVSPGNPATRTLAEVLAAFDHLGAGIDGRTLLPYARLADGMAELDLRQLDGEGDPLAQAERAVLVTVLLEPALLALRRLAQEDKSSRLFGGAHDDGADEA
ncbi:MerR family transcriptional regulator [Streptomyces sp. R302]|uniref:MerR family transcriptional regulator n=1 Tax=unclassified Streptomyces TaxID=2593676 RepID=UPI00145CDD53|nr:MULTISPECIES: MerR family transcriptional regulator [unclassified Streptomyces]NML51801.1 MerR family transcriptional regulator [Streptomyces sp. R301]NML81421.1 MerR family transcriptional regulator [Streptomyces sp. R302]